MWQGVIPDGSTGWQDPGTIPDPLTVDDLIVNESTTLNATNDAAGDTIIKSVSFNIINVDASADQVIANGSWNFNSAPIQWKLSGVYPQLFHDGFFNLQLKLPSNGALEIMDQFGGWVANIRDGATTQFFQGLEVDGTATMQDDILVYSNSVFRRGLHINSFNDAAGDFRIDAQGFDYLVYTDSSVGEFYIRDSAGNDLITAGGSAVNINDDFAAINFQIFSQAGIAIFSTVGSSGEITFRGATGFQKSVVFNELSDAAVDFTVKSDTLDIITIDSGTESVTCEGDWTWNNADWVFYRDDGTTPFLKVESGSSNDTKFGIKGNSNEFTFNLRNTSNSLALGKTSNPLSGTNTAINFQGGSELIVSKWDHQFDNDIGFYGTAPISKPTASGSRGGNAALASLLTALSNLGLITDSTSA